jgi:hypothetical protein
VRPSALAAQARVSARGRGAQAELAAARRLEELADRCQRVVAQIQQRQRGEKLGDRLVSLVDPDARPIRKGKLGRPNEFGYVAQVAEVTANTRRGARGYLLPAATARATRARTACWPRPPPSWTAWGCDRARSPSTAASGPARPPRPWPRWRRPGRSSRDGPSPAPGGPASGWPATAPAARAASATSSALRAAPQPAEGRAGPANLDRLGDPGLQPRHPRPPDHLTAPATALSTRPTGPRRPDGLTSTRLSGASN